MVHLGAIAVVALLGGEPQCSPLLQTCVYQVDPAFGDAFYTSTSSYTADDAKAICNKEHWRGQEKCHTDCALQLVITDPPELRSIMCLGSNTFTPYDGTQHIDILHPLQDKVLQIEMAGLSETDPTRTGCNPSDYASKDFSGKLALMRRGACFFYQKLAAARDHGAVAGIVVNHRTTNSIATQTQTMAGQSQFTKGFPGMFMSRHFGDPLVEALDAGIKVFGKLRVDCEVDTTPPELDDECPSTSLIEPKTCDAQEDDENRLCIRCPVEATVTAGSQVQVCLWGHRLLPRSAHNYLQHSKTLPLTLSNEVVLATSMPEQGCLQSDYAGLSGKYVIMMAPAKCLLFNALRAADRAGAAGVILMTQTSSSTIVFPEGSSVFVSLPVHTVSPGDAARLLSAVAHPQAGLAQFSGGAAAGFHIASMALREGVMPPKPNATTTAAPATHAVEIVTETTGSALEMNAVVVICILLGVLLLATICILFVKQRRSSADLQVFPDPTIESKFSIPLSMASLSLSLSLLVVISCVAFILAYSAGKDATDTATDNGQTATEATYQNAADNVLLLSKQLRVSTNARVQQGLANLLDEGALASTNVANLLLGMDGSWDSLRSNFQDLVQQGRASRWTLTVLTEQNYFIMAGRAMITMTDDRTDVARGDGYPHVSVTQNGLLYQLALFDYSPQRFRAEYWYTTPTYSWRVNEQLSGGLGNPHALTRGRPRYHNRWFLTRETSFTLLDQRELYVAAFTPIYNRANVYIGAAEARVTVAEVVTLLTDTAGEDSNITLVVYDMVSRVVLGSNTYASIFGSYAIPGVSLRAANMQYTLDTIPTLQIQALGAMLRKTPLVVDPETGSRSFSGQFDQAAHYPHRSFEIMRLQAGASSSSVVDVSGNAYYAELRGGVCGVDSPQCFVSVAGERALRFDGEAVMHIYQNLTVDVRRIREAQIGSSPYRSSLPHFGESMRIPNTTQDCVSYTNIVSATDRGTYCLLRNIFYTAPFTVHVKFRSDEFISPEGVSTPRLFSTGFFGDIGIRLFANGMLWLGTNNYGCRIGPLAEGTAANTWYLMTATIDYRSRRCAVYVNGALHEVSPIAASFGPPLTDTALSVGQGLKGHVSDFRVFNFSLTEVEVSTLHESGQFTRDVPSRDWYVDVSAVVREGSGESGIHWGVGVLIPRDTIMGRVDENNRIMRRNLAVQEGNTQRKLDQIVNESILILCCLVLFSMLLFLIFNDMLTKPFSSVAQAMSDAAVMRIQSIPTKRSAISELDLMYTAMKQMLENLESYRPFLPDALFENMQWVPKAPERDSQLPPGMRTGVVAIVFTDIQSSTKLWEACPAGMKVALKVHNSVIRECIERFHGYEVKIIGDSYMVAFDKATDAVDFSLSVHECLYESDWPADILQVPECAPDKTHRWKGLRVRIGINFGDADVEFNPVSGRYDYFGPTVNKASRIEAAGVAGAVTLSKEVLDEVVDSHAPLNDGSSLRGSDNSASAMQGDSGLSGLTIPATLFTIGFLDLKGVATPSFITVLLPAKLGARTAQIRAAVDDKKKNVGLGAGPTQPDKEDKRSSHGSSVVSKNSAGKAYGRKRYNAMNKVETKPAVTLGRIGVAVESATESGEAIQLANDGLGKVLSCLDRTDGTVVCVLSCSVQAGWNTAKACPSHLESSFRFLRLLKSSINERPEFFRIFSIGISTGSALYGNVGNHMQKFITVVGSSVTLCGHLASTAASLNAFCLHAAVPSQCPSAWEEPSLRGLCRPIDEWRVVNRPAETVTIYEVKTDSGADRWVSEEGHESSNVAPSNWGWTDSYLDAFANKDYFRIRTHCSDDEILQTVAGLFENDRHLRDNIRL